MSSRRDPNEGALLTAQGSPGAGRSSARTTRSPTEPAQVTLTFLALSLSQVFFCCFFAHVHPLDLEDCTASFLYDKLCVNSGTFHTFLGPFMAFCIRWWPTEGPSPQIPL